jgi:predicted O-linked N-acetylglucosamine transferase (SPINDLY family)
MRTHPDKIVIKKQRAMQLLQSGQADAACELLAGICKGNPRDAEAWLYLGAGCEAAGKARQALDCYEKAVKLMPGLFQAQLSLGNLYKRLGKPGQAIQCYTRALEIQPDNPGVIANMGNAWLRSGDFQKAAGCFRRALVLAPGTIPAQQGLGIALHGLGDDEGAISCLTGLLQHKSDHFAAWKKLGEIHAQRGDYQEAIRHLRKARALNPGSVAAAFALGNTLLASGDGAAAIPVFEEVLALAPEDPEVLNSYGFALSLHAEPRAAIRQFRKALDLRRDYTPAWNNLGIALQSNGELDEAERCFRKVIDLQPDFVQAYNNLANVLIEKECFDDALLMCDEALERNPGYLEALANRGNALKGLFRYCDAAEAFRRALEINPAHHGLYNNLGEVLLDSGQVDQAIACYRRSLEIYPDDHVLHSGLVFSMNYLDLPADQVYRAHRGWAAVHAPGAAADGCSVPAHDRPRVGFVSPDFRMHSVAYFLEPALDGLAREAVDVYCYSDVERPDTMTQHIRRLAGHWRDCLMMDDERLLERIREDEIDILVDLAGHTQGNRLRMFARRAAPVQLAWLGYANTTGLDAMDYRLTDAVADPPGMTEQFHSEQLLRMPGAFLCFRGIESGCEVTPLPAGHAGNVTFGSFNNLSKMTPDVVALWAGILNAVPGARLLLKNKSFRDPGTCELYYRRFAEHGIDRERLDFMGWVSMREHFALYGKVDIALDTFPYNGTTTTCEALWMGVPVITLAGRVHAARVGASLLGCVGLDEWVADDKDGYLELARRGAANLQELASLRHELRERMRNSSLCDISLFASRLERLFAGLMESPNRQDQ